MKQTEDVDAGWVLRALGRRWMLIAGCALAGILIALGLSLTATEKYSAEATLLFREPAFTDSVATQPSGPDPEREAATNLALVSLDVVAARTADELENEFSGSEIASVVTVESGGQSDLATVVAETEDPEASALIANVFANSYVAFRREADQRRLQAAQRVIETNLDRLDKDERQGEEGDLLQEQLDGLRNLEALQTGNAEVVQEAKVPKSPSSPKTRRNVALGFLLGLLVGCVVAVLRARLDRRLRDPKEFEGVFGLPLLATIPESKPLAKSDTDRMEKLLESDAEALRTLRARLRYFNVDREIKAVLVTSTAPGDGKTTVSWSFAVSACRAGAKVLFVEADLHRPVVAGREGLAPIPGLAELLSEQATLDHAVQSVPVAVRAGANGAGPETSTMVAKGPADTAEGPALDVLVAGSPPPNAGEMLESASMTELLTKAREDYDLVVIDTPPLSIVSDAMALLGQVDGAVLVARFGSTTRDAAEEIRGLFESLDAHVLGLIVNRASARRYGYGYGYARSESTG